MEIRPKRRKLQFILAAIRAKRLGLQYTQEYMAFKLEISQNAYSKIELGYTKLTVETLFNIADLLETDITDFLLED
ncbi:MAG: helix-turn-helix transcriptional regulator [Bacteroidota bacterium]